MSTKFNVACVQNRAGPDVQANIEDAVQLCREARRAGAELICTPEFFTCFDKSDDALLIGAFPSRSTRRCPFSKTWRRSSERGYCSAPWPYRWVLKSSIIGRI